MKRKALVGTSSPIGYDYSTQVTKVPSDSSSSPNPILDSPFGLLLLYDEIWFFCRSLCPENMRDLKYVHFVDEELGIPTNVGSLDWEALEELKVSPDWKDIVCQRKIIPGRDPFREGFGSYGVHWDNSIDNHTHGLNIGGIPSSGNPTEYRLLFDLVLSNRLGLEDYELITNSYTHTMIRENNTHLITEHEFAEYMVIRDIPNYITRHGPYHSVIEEARDNKYLKYFRKWISGNKTITDPNELKEVKESVEASIQEIQDKLFLKHLDPSSLYKSLGKSVVGDALGMMVPGTSTIATSVEHFTNRKKKKDIRWQGFLVSIKGKV